MRMPGLEPARPLTWGDRKLLNPPFTTVPKPPRKTSPEKPAADDDSGLFRRAMADVTPLHHDTVEPHAKPPAPRRRRAEPAAQASSNQTGFVERPYLDEVAPEEPLFFARPGLQQRLLRRLKRGEIPVEARLDLHGATIDAAGLRVSDFLTHAQAHRQRCVLMVHGKGHRSGTGRGVLKTQLNHWLRDHPAILAFCSAQPGDGGTGALYVLLRRS
jgi:DNA-nicking Smr family endonuclease